MLGHQPRQVQGQAGQENERISRKELRAGLPSRREEGVQAQAERITRKKQSNNELTKNKGIKQLKAGTGQSEHQAQQGLCAAPGQSPEEGAQKN